MTRTITKVTNRARLINVQERDIQNLTLLARWWCITPEHMARDGLTETEIKEIWESDTPEAEKKRLLLKRSERRRMTKLGTVTPYLLTSGYAQNFGSVYWLTAHGARLTGAPFKGYPSGNLTRAPHAWAAADIGMRLEREGYRVFSEREFACGETVDREVIWDKPHSSLRPDITIPTEDGKYIFIEVERKINGTRSYYERKLNTYLANPRVAAVWYITDKKVVAQRVHGVYQRVKPNHPPKPFRVLPMQTLENHYTSFTGWEKNAESLTRQLTELGAVKKESENNHP